MTDAAGRDRRLAQMAVYGGRCARCAIAGWEYGARTLGPLFFAPPLETAQRHRGRSR